MHFLGALLLLHLREGIVVYLVMKDKVAGHHAAMRRPPPSSFRANGSARSAARCATPWIAGSR